MATTDATPMSESATVSADIPPEVVNLISGFMENMGVLQQLKPEHNLTDYFSHLVSGVLKLTSVQRGKLSCLLNVKAPILVSLFLLEILFLC